MSRQLPAIRFRVRTSSLWFATTVLGCALTHCVPQVAADDWPTYRCDAARSGVTGESLPGDLSLQWTYTPAHRPKPAWPAPSEEMPRMHADNAFHVALAGGRAFFGSSVTDEVCAIDIASGDLCWSFFTEGPVRFAPTVRDGRVYAGSDDGYVYCLSATDGSLIWRRRPGPSDEKVLGNGRMISLWPVRTSVLVDRGVVYCGAGVFPYEGIYICALSADDGSVVWKNDTIGDRAHELSYGGITCHGYLLVSDDALYVPAGRAMPAAFSRRTGEFLFWASPGGKQGGAWSLLHEDELIAGVDRSGTPHKVAYDPKTGRSKGDVFAWFPGLDMVIRGNFAYVLTPAGLYAIDRKVHADALEKVGVSTKTREELGKELVQLREGIAKADADGQAKIRLRIDEVTRLVAGHLAEEQRLQKSCCTWHLPTLQCRSLILAGDTLFVGGSNQVLGVDARAGTRVWQAGIAGNAVGLAAGSGSLIVSTEEGSIHGFAAAARVAPKVTSVAHDPNVFRDHPKSDLYHHAARQIVDRSNIAKGYCLVLDGNTGQLAYELSRITDLQIIDLVEEPSKVDIARKKLLSVGLLGARVIVEPWDIDSLPPYFANLVVSDDLLTTGAREATQGQVERVLRPGGGTAIAAVPEGASGLQWRTFTRPPLEGVAGWTHQYGNPQNTACSPDSMAKGPLGVLWFGEPGPLSMVERHARAQSPVAMDGRLFVQGEELILALDAYNGTSLWQRRIPGAVRPRVDVDGGNLALDRDALYIAAYDKCIRLDPATGRTVRVYDLPGGGSGSYRWGCVSIDRSILFGTRAKPLKQPYATELKAKYADPNDDVVWEYTRSNAEWLPMANYPLWENYSPAKGSVTDRMMTGDMVFALDPDTGKVRWTHPGKRIANLTLSLGDGKVFFADSAITDAQAGQALDERRTLIRDGVYEETEDMKKAQAYESSDTRLVVALDAQSGEKLWERVVDFTGCCGDAMGSACQDDVLLFFGCVGNHDAYRFRENQLAYRRIVAMSASSGAILWSRPVNYRTRPVVVGDRIIIEPRACDLRTGRILARVDPISDKEVPWEFLRPGHTCAITSASASALFYRSSSIAIYDLARDAGVALFGGIRPGCWINMIPANGLVLVPEASVGCTCSFPLRGSFALVNKPQRAQPWTVFINHTDLDARGQMVPGTYGRPVKHLAINFGAPADMKDDDGTLWLAYPNPKTAYSQNHFVNYGIKFDLKEDILRGMGYFCRDFKGIAVMGTEKPWLFTSGCLGLLRCEIPLLDHQAGEVPTLYTVRLGFRAVEGDRPGQRLFDIRLQGQTVLEAFDIAQSAGGAGKAVIRDFTDIAVDDKLVLELVPRTQTPGESEAPLINFVEIVCSHRRIPATAKGM
ncbi:MAG: PQQ-binding-like beta-propeller repeat protein [Phycisphaerae bacterium]|nr:PQQ-binding-like beta-propeller repeat protein [Phycisphaerae bacterium]